MPYLLVPLYIGLVFPVYGQIRPHGTHIGRKPAVKSYSFSHPMKTKSASSRHDVQPPKMMATPVNAYSYGRNNDLQRYQTRPGGSEELGSGLSANYKYREYHGPYPLLTKPAPPVTKPQVKTEEIKPEDPAESAAPVKTEESTSVSGQPSDVALFHRLGDIPETKLLAGDPYERAQREARRVQCLVQNGVRTHVKERGMFARQLLREKYAPTHYLDNGELRKFNAIIEAGLTGTNSPRMFLPGTNYTGLLPNEIK